MESTINSLRLPVCPEDSALVGYTQKKHHAFPFRRSDLGGSGQTYLPLDPYFEWVIKWQNPLQAECEHVCTEFYRRVFEQYSTPHTFLVSEEKTKEVFSNFFFKHKIDIASIYSPLFMEFKQGNNLEKACLNGNLFQLKDGDLQTLFTTFGEVAGFDLAIGNSDRFFPMNFRGVVDPAFKMNSGNIMIEVMDSHALQSVHLIDNAPHFQNFFGTLERKNTEVISDGLDESLVSCFGSDSTTSSTSLETSSEDDDDISGEVLREQRSADFQYFAAAPHSDIEAMARQIQLGIKNALVEAEDSIQRENVLKLLEGEGTSPLILDSLIEGLKKAKITMQEEKIFPLIEDLLSNSWEEETTLILLEFIKENIKYVQKLNSIIESETIE